MCVIEEKRHMAEKIANLDNARAHKKPRREPEIGVTLGDFLAYMPAHGYIFVPSRELWPAASVNARVPPIVGPDGKPIAPSKEDERRPQHDLRQGHADHSRPP